MTSLAAEAPAGRSPHTPSFGSLLGAELMRIRSRRFAKVMVLLLVGVTVLLTVLVFRGTEKPTAASIERARAACVSSVDAPEGVVQSDSGPAIQQAPPDAAGTGGPVSPDVARECATVEQIVQHGGFGKGNDPAIPSDLAGVAIGVGVGVAVLGFLFGCTLGGADWSNRTMPALLFWEPRRVRLVGVKLLAFAIALVALMLAAVVLWWLIYAAMIGVHGTWDDGSTGVVGDMLDSVGRLAVYDVCAGLLGFAIANLTRNTGAALGAAFVYLAIVETFVRIYLERLVPWELTTNVGALLAQGGLDVQVGGRTVHISSVQGGLVLAAFTLVACVAAGELFRRRDVT